MNDPKVMTITIPIKMLEVESVLKAAEQLIVALVNARLQKSLGVARVPGPEL